MAYQCMSCMLMWKDKKYYDTEGTRVMPACPECRSREHVVSVYKHRTKKEMTNEPRIKQLSEFGIISDIDTGRMAKWEMGETHTVTGVVMLTGEFGGYPGFEVETGELLFAGGVAVMRTADSMKEVFSQFPNIGFELVLQEKESRNGRIYNVLVELPKEAPKQKTPKEPKDKEPVEPIK